MLQTQTTFDSSMRKIINIYSLMWKFIFVYINKMADEARSLGKSKTNTTDPTNEEDSEDDWIGPNPNEAAKPKKQKSKQNWFCCNDII